MRDPGPFECDILVEHNVWPVIRLVQLPILLAEQIGRQGLARAAELRDAQLELGEHRLAVERGAELLKEVIDEVSALPLVGRLLEQVLHQQGLVAGRGDLSHEDDIILIDGRLRVVREVGVQGVAHFVCERELAVERAGVVQQDERMDKCAGGVRAGALADVFIDVDPAVREALIQKIAILFAQAGQRLGDGLFGLFIRDIDVYIGQKRGIDVVKMQLVQTHQPLAQAHVAVHFVKIVMDSFDQIGIDTDRNLGRVEGGLLRRGVIASLREELQLLDLCAEHGGEGVFIVLIDAVIGVVGVLAEGTVRRFQAGHIGALRDLMGVPLSVQRVREFHVGVGEQGEHAVRRARHLARGSQQLFFLFGENMRAFAPNDIKMAAIKFELRHVLVELLHRLIGDGQQLRHLEARLLAELNAGLRELADQVLEFRDAGILIGAAVGIVAEGIIEHRDLLVQVHVGEQILRGSVEFSGVGGQFLAQGLQFLQILLPQGGRSIEVFDGPFVFLGDFVSFRDFFHGFVPFLCSMVS